MVESWLDKLEEKELNNLKLEDMSQNIEQENLNIDLHKAILFVLRNEYFKEFEVIDGFRQHPRGFNFEQWLQEQHLII